MQTYGEQLSVYVTVDKCLNFSVCCLLRQNGNGSGNESVNVNGSETACSDLEQVTVNETWSGTWTWRGIWLQPCPLLMSSSLECGWQIWSGSWSGCGCGNDSLSGSSCGNGSGSCCDCWGREWKVVLKIRPLLQSHFNIYDIILEILTLQSCTALILDLCVKTRIWISQICPNVLNYVWVLFSVLNSIMVGNTIREISY